MNGPAHGWWGGPWTRCAAIIAAAALLAGARPDRLGAQVGHDPSSSPYHDVPPGNAGVVAFGYLAGSRGKVGVGPSNGATGGLRYEFTLGAIAVSLGLAYAQTTRFVVDPTRDAQTRTSGPFGARVVLADAGLQLVLTGRKTWRGFAPYIGGALGVAANPGPPHDTSGYDFGTKLTLAPDAGLRWYPARRLSVRGDVRLVLWKLSYPVSYRLPNQFDNTRVLSLSDPLSEWTAHPWVTIGVGWIF